MRALVRKLTWWVQRRRKEAELADELQFHLAQEAEELRAAGMRTRTRSGRRDGIWAARSACVKSSGTVDLAPCRRTRQRSPLRVADAV